MFCLKNLILVSIIIGFVYSKQICYDTYGCFIDTVPFGGTAQRPLSALPDIPAKIGTTFTLYNR